MLTNTFCHLSRISLKREQTLWSNGITSWDILYDFLESDKKIGFAVNAQLKKEIKLSMDSHRSGDPGFFASRLPSHQIWRLFNDFRANAVYLDIETTGLSIPIITTISLYDGINIRYYVYGANLEDFIEHIRQYKVIITYNGKCFDIPLIESFFRIKLDQAHIDLRYVLKRLGYCGGLKACEKQAGISRDELDGVDGYFAVLLWNDYYYNGNSKALDTLLAYNIADVVNLEKLMVMSYNQNARQISLLKPDILPDPLEPLLPFQPDTRTIQRLKEQHYFPANF